jgi:hypothetical protein
VDVGTDVRVRIAIGRTVADPRDTASVRSGEILRLLLVV